MPDSMSGASSPGPGPGPEALVLAVRAGDATALDRWYREEHPRVWRLCLGLLANAAEAEDAAQDAMLHLLDRLGRWDARRSWAAWRNAVVVNLCRDRMRRLGALRRAEERAAETRLPTSLPSPVSAAERAEVREAVVAALDALSPREREAFVLCDLEGFAPAEAAGALEIAESSVRSLLSLARRRLRNLLAPRLSASRGGALGETHA
jgi:RNA polymerase sigma-70 factor (ECF subfamily)